ncbi:MULTISPECIES: hypothetical protein [unclassified Sphingomonas]|uniref:hypothetical protein n=1 Tax=unclassified Sphingomonas TaxID=196159 RepID=UPI0007003180|nr:MULTISPECIES: hypothetical protein [unclassified Sphingomonas]KQX19319.1 hypothetical protein ASD17_12305 [Sphingomonas sp. Root1294]KQY65522.1 hypothetical protein ASD39_15505 [Sphingomonas sp. Root50]KRB95178.1 hypothetical protein ASE22_04555 [Sphingomonas sp. Root720]
MPKVNAQWTVGPHGPVERIDEGLVTVAGEIRMPLGNFPRRMVVVALGGGRSAIWSAIPLREAEMEEIEALGAPAVLIVPGVAHRLDIVAWKRRYPDAAILCSPGARDAVAEVVPVDATHDILDDPLVRFETVPGFGGKEAALLIRRGDRVTLVVNDILANVRHPHGLGALVMARLMGFGVDRPKMPWLGKRLFVKDTKAVVSAFRAWAAEPGLARIVVSHGDVIADDPRAVLERVAGELE